MIELSELFAACIIEYTRRREDEILTGPAYVMIKDARDSFNLPYDEEIFRAAIRSLEHIGCLKKHSHKGMQSYYRIEAKLFESQMKEGSFGVRHYKLGAHLGSSFDPFEPPSSSDTQADYAFLESYADIGSDFLAEALEAAEERLSTVGDKEGDSKIGTAQDEVVDFPLSGAMDSSSWTGLPTNFELTQQLQKRLVSDLDRVEAALADAAISQDERSQARAYIIAMRVLAEAPEPQTDLIWEMLGRVNQLAGVASLFVSIVALFATVAH